MDIKGDANRNKLIVGDKHSTDINRQILQTYNH